MRLLNKHTVDRGTRFWQQDYH